MNWKYKVGEEVEVNVNDMPEKRANKEPSWVRAQIAGKVNYSGVPAYGFANELRSGHGKIYLEIYVRSLNA